MTNRFDESGYGSTPIGFGERPAVVVVDFQAGFTQPEFPCGKSPHIHSAVDNTATLLHEARKRNIPVASCVVSWASKKDMQHWKIAAIQQGMFYGDPSTVMDERVYDPDYDFNFVKSAPSAFFGSPLVAFLTKQKVDTVIVTGCTTSGCVRGTIIDSFSYGYRTIVPEECVGDMEEGPHWDNLRDVERRYADVLKLESVLSYFEKIGKLETAA